MRRNPIKDDLKITMTPKRLIEGFKSPVIDLTSGDISNLQGIMREAIAAPIPTGIPVGIRHAVKPAVVKPECLHVNLKPRMCRSCEKISVKNLYDLCETCDKDQRRKAAILRGARIALAEYEAEQTAQTAHSAQTAQTAQSVHPAQSPIVEDTIPGFAQIYDHARLQSPVPSKNDSSDDETREPPREIRSTLLNPPKFNLVRKVLNAYVESDGTVKDDESAQKLWGCSADEVIRILRVHLPSNRNLMSYPHTWKLGRIDTSQDFTPDNIKLIPRG